MWKVERLWCLANSLRKFCMIRFTERAVVFRNRSCSQGDCTFNYSNPHLISYRILEEFSPGCWFHGVMTYTGFYLLRLLTFFFNGKWPCSGNFSIVFSYKKIQENLLAHSSLYQQLPPRSWIWTFKKLPWAKCSWLLKSAPLQCYRLSLYLRF